MQLGSRIYGLSLDDVKAQAAFHEAQKLSFPLLSDPDGSVARKYGVFLARGFANRVTFVIDPNGVLRHVDQTVAVDSHGRDLIELLTRLKSE